MLDALDPFLANLNPVLRYLEFQKTTVTDFLAGPGVALANSIDPIDANQAAPRHYLRQLGYLGAETIGAHPVAAVDQPLERLPRAGRADRPASSGLAGCSPASTAATWTTTRRPPRARPRRSARRSTPPTTRIRTPRRAGRRLSFAPCIIEEPFPGGFSDTRFPNLFSDP